MDELTRDMTRDCDAVRADGLCFWMCLCETGDLSVVEARGDWMLWNVGAFLERLVLVLVFV